MFIKCKNNIVLNTKYIEYMEAVTKREIYLVEKLFTLKELADMGFPIRRKHVFVDTVNESEADKMVALSPGNRFKSCAQTGYVEIDGGDEGVTDKYYTIENGNVVEHKDENYFLDSSKVDDIIAYKVTMETGKVFLIRYDDYKRIK